MCGIIGFSFKDEKLLLKTNKILEHRGPENSGIYVDEKVSLGHNRLSIIDLSADANQPMSLLDRYVITFNGEIYNYKEIQKELSDYNFQTTSDTEIIVCAYDKWGPDFLQKLNGMFAFCIYDKKTQQFFIARDRFGIKPLYYLNQKSIIFSSEIKALLPFIKKKEIDKEGLNQFFNFRFTLGETTLIKNIKKFLPGHFMIYDLNKNKISEYQKYYELEKQNIENKSFNFYKDKLTNLMQKSVERRMVSDVPVACLLSGGVDSSIITMLASKYNKNINTFSIGFETTNELPYAKLVSEFLGTNHHEFKINKNDVLSYLDKMIYHMEEPIGDPGFLPILILSGKVKKYNKVVLSGDGGDEVFCGYDRYKFLYYGSKLKHFAFCDLNNDIIKKLKLLKNKDESNSFFEIIRLFDDMELKKLGFKKYNFQSYWTNKYKNSVTNAQEFDIRTLLPGDFFMKSDKMSSAFGLEQRVPFLDHELVEFAFSIPFKYKLKLWNEKHILKEAFKNKLPKEIIKRRKHGFNVPIDYWFRNVLGEKLKAYLLKDSHNLYNKDYVLKLLDDIKKQKNNYKLNFILAQKLWSILVFEMWYERYME